MDRLKTFKFRETSKWRFSVDLYENWQKKKTTESNFLFPLSNEEELNSWIEPTYTEKTIIIKIKEKYNAKYGISDDEFGLDLENENNEIVFEDEYDLDKNQEKWFLLGFEYVLFKTSNGWEMDLSIFSYSKLKEKYYDKNIPHWLNFHFENNILTFEQENVKIYKEGLKMYFGEKKYHSTDAFFHWVIEAFYFKKWIDNRESILESKKQFGIDEKIYQNHLFSKINFEKPFSNF